jgi:hypothetical protein
MSKAAVSQTNKTLVTSTRVEDPIYQRSLTIFSSTTISAYLVALRRSQVRSSVYSTCPLWHVGLDRVLDGSLPPRPRDVRSRALRTL